MIRPMCREASASRITSLSQKSPGTAGGAPAAALSCRVHAAQCVAVLSRASRAPQPRQ